MRLIDPDKKSFQRREVVKLLPVIHQSQTLQKFFGATANHLFQPGESQSINGYVGQKPAHFRTTDTYIPDSTDERTFYQLEPTVVSMDGTGVANNLMTYGDYVNYLRRHGADVSNHDRLFSQEWFSWCPPVDLDKLLNYRQYFFSKEGPEPREVMPFRDITADGKTQSYVLPGQWQVERDVVITQNGRTLPASDYTLTATHVTFITTPANGDEIRLWVYQALSIEEIIGKKTFTTSGVMTETGVISGFPLSSGMKIRLWDWQGGYVRSDYIIEGVGRSIRAIRDTSRETLQVMPYRRYTADGSTKAFALPEGTNNGVMVMVNNVEAIADLSYVVEDRHIVFASTYVPVKNSTVEVWLLRDIVISDIIGQPQYGNDTITLLNGMKINLMGNIIGDQRYRGEFHVSGVGTAITLTEDTSRWKDLDYPDYIVMERGDVTENDWSTGNRWFHRDVLGNVPGAVQASRPIVEFAANIQLYRYGEVRRKDAQHVLSGSITYTKGGITTTGPVRDFFPILTGASQIIINGREVHDQDRILVLTDGDDLVNNRVFLANFTNEFRFTLEPDGSGEGGEPVVGEIIRLPDHERYWTGLEWRIAQKKATINSAPLFTLYDQDGIPLDDGETHPGSDFAGNAIFGYHLSTAASIDPVLGLPVLQQSTGKGSEFIFENHLYTGDMRGYYGTAHPVIDGVATPYRDNAGLITGYSYFRDITTGEMDSGWYKATSPSRQWNVVTQWASGTTVVPYPLTPYRDIVVRVNGKDHEWIATTEGVSVTVPEGSFIEVKAWGEDPQVIRGFWAIPANLQANPNNGSVTTITRGGFYPHFTSCLTGQEGFTGVPYGANNYRDTARARNLGMDIVQHSAPMLKSMVLASDDGLDLISAIHASEREYSRMKEKVLNCAKTFHTSGAIDDQEDGSVWLEECLRIVNMGKTASFPYGNSGMAGSAWIPATPAYLGVGEVYVPREFLDTTLPTPTPAILGHDGSVTLAYGDVRDKVLLAWETAIYRSIVDSVRNAPLPVDGTVVSGKYRKGAYSREEFNTILSPLYERWCSLNAMNGRRNDGFDPGNIWTWNFSTARDRDGDALPGHWSAIYRHYYDTATPHLTPWEMLGYGDKPTWWDARYGAAPYTSGNDLLWGDVRSGYRFSLDGIDARYARPNAPIPVDLQGNLLSVVDCGIVDPATIPTYEAASADWRFGDGGSVERVWRRTSAYAFHMAIARYLARPNVFIELGWDVGSLSRDGEFRNLEIGSRPRNSQLTVHSPTHRVIGIQQWVADALLTRGQSTTYLEDTIRGLDVRLAYRVGGFTDGNSLQAVADNFDRVPDEDMTIRVYRSPSVREEHYSGVVVEWTGSGWKVFGYNASSPFFTIIPSDINGPSSPIVIGEERDYPTWRSSTYYPRGTTVLYRDGVYRSVKSHTSATVFEETFWEATTVSASPLVLRIADFHRADINLPQERIPYGTEFHTQQEVWDFLISYERYLVSRGWIFDGFDPEGNPETFRQAGMSFLNWSILNLPPGNFISLSPCGTTLHFKTQHGMVGNIEQTTNGQHSIVNREGFPIDITMTNITRYDDEVTVRSIDETAGMYSCYLTISEIEHIVIFSNRTIFQDLIYDPVLNLRQPRLRLQGHRSSNWKGRMDAPGYLITDNLLIPNFDKSAETFRHLYDVESFENVQFREMARGNIGYQRRAYMDNLLMSSTSQFDFYRGMIRQKGTAAAMEKLLRSSHVSGGADVRFMEEWALRLGTYGAVAVKQYMEFSLPQGQIRNNPQAVIFSDVLGGQAMDDPWDEVITLSKDDERWIHRPEEAFPLGDAGYRAKTAGPILVGETKWSFTTTGHFLTAVQAGVDFQLADTAWVYDRNGRWDVLRLTDKTVTLAATLPGTGVEIGAVVDEDGMLIVEGSDTLPDGIYEIGKAERSADTYNRSFSYTDAAPTRKSFSTLVDIVNSTDDHVTSVVIPAKDALDLTLLTTVHLRTLETTGDNFRGRWTKRMLGSEAIQRPSDIEDIFGMDFSQQGVAFSLKTNGEIFHPTVLGTVQVYLNGTALTPGTYFLDPIGEWIFLSTYVSRQSVIQQRPIRDTDVIEVEVLSNPQISIGTATDPERFFRRDQTPALTNPMGVLVEYPLPYWMSLDNGASTLTEDIIITLYRDAATQGRIQVTIDAIQMIGEGQTQVLEIPGASSASIDEISITVREAFQPGNIFGSNQLLIGDTSNTGRFVNEGNFPKEELLTTGEKILSLPLPYGYSTDEKIIVSFQQGWSMDLLNRFGLAVSDARSYDYLTTPDEWLRELPYTYRPGTELSVKINGVAHSRYTGPWNGDFSNLQWEIITGPEPRLYFGERLQETVNGTARQYPVGMDNTIRTFPLPGTPTVEVIGGIRDASILPIIGGGKVLSVEITDGGTGYSDGYTEVEILGSGTGATATATVLNGSIVAVTVTNGGANYTTAPYVIFRDIRKVGKGAKATAILSRDGIQNFIINSAGEYATTPTITITPENSAAVTARLGKARVKTVEVTGGTGYTQASITYRSAPVIPAHAVSRIDESGRLLLIAITDKGANYHTVPNIIISGDGHDAAATAVIDEGGSLVGIQITNYGSGYTSAPSVIITGGDVEETLPCGVTITEVEVPEGEPPVDPIVTITAPISSLSFFNDPIVTLTGDGVGAVVTFTMENRGLAAVSIVSTGENFRRGVEGRDVVEVRLHTTGGYRVLARDNTLDGYRVVGNMITFMKPPRFADSYLTIILHHPVKVARTEDVDISTPEITFTPASSGELSVDIRYSVVTSKIRYISDLSGNPLAANTTSDPFTLLPVGEVSLTGKMWDSVVFPTLAALQAYMPETAWQTGDLAWVGEVTYRWNNGWEKYREAPEMVDYRRVNGALIFDSRSGLVTQNLTLWNPLLGYLPGGLDGEISYRVDYDPALYDQWGDGEVGTLWWDRSTTYFLDYRLGDLPYRTKFWGAVAPGTSVDIYEWVKSPVLPEDWAEYSTGYKRVPGEWYPSGDAGETYRTVQQWNSQSGVDETFYYFWVKNPESIPHVNGRTISARSISAAISNPETMDLPWWAPLSPTSILLGGVAKFLTDDSSILQINWQTSATKGNVHREWLLLREGDERSPIPAPLWDKMTASLVGWDAGTGMGSEWETDTTTLGEVSRLSTSATPVGTDNGPQLVPDPSLHWREMVGGEIRPRQTWFVPDRVSNRYAPSAKARAHFVSTVNSILYDDQVAWELDTLFPNETPIPTGASVTFNPQANQRFFTLPQSFKTDRARVVVKSPQGVEEVYRLGTGPGTYVFDKVKIQNTTYPRLVFSTDILRFSTVVVQDGDLHHYTVGDVLDRDALWLAGKVQYGEKVLLTGQEWTSGFWTIWEATMDFTGQITVPDGCWKLVNAQTYRISDFVTEMDWWEGDYQSRDILATFSTTAHRNAAMPRPSVGDVVKILDNGSGKWFVTVWNSRTWQVVGRERHIKQLLPFAGQPYAGPGFQWSDLENDFSIIGKRDGSWELNIILQHLNPLLSVEDDSIMDVRQSNEVFFSMLYLAHCQNVMVDWAFKTSYLYVGGYNEPLTASPIQTADQTPALLQYINEVKPYRVKIRDFVRRLSPEVEWANTYVTDFDKPPVYDERLAQNIIGLDKSRAYRPLSVIPNMDGTYTIPDDDFTTLSTGYWPINLTSEDSGKQYWRDWLNNSTINPQQPNGVVADSTLIRTLRVKMRFDRTDDFATTEVDGGSVGGWGGGIPALGWDIPAWDREPTISSASGLSQYYPQPGMWKRDPATLIPGIDYRGVGIDGYSFQNGEVDVEIDGGQMDQAAVATPAYGIDLDGGDFTNPYMDEGHPPELIKVRPLDGTAMTVYQRASVGSPLISTYRYSGVKELTSHGWGPYQIGGEIQHREALMVLRDGRQVPESEWTIVDSRLYFTTQQHPSAVISITGFSIGGGTPYGKVDYISDGVTNRYAIPDTGKIINNRLQVFREFTDIFAVQNGNWSLRESGYREDITGVAYGNGQYLAVGKRIALSGEVSLHGAEVTVTTTVPHGMETGYILSVEKAPVKALEGDWVITVTSPTTLTYMLPTALTAPARGLLEGRGPSRILRSLDGLIWTALPGVKADLNGVMYRDGFVLWGTGGMILSGDGQTFTHQFVSDRDIHTVLHTGEKWVVIGQGMVYLSDDFVNWTTPFREVERTIGITIPLRGIIAGTNTIPSRLTEELALTFAARGQVGMSMGALDPRYRDVAGVPLDPNDDSTFFWSVGDITILQAGADGRDGVWKASLQDGQGQACHLSLTVMGGTVTGVEIIDAGKYSVVPTQAAFTISGSALSQLGLEKGRHLITTGKVPTPTVTDGAKMKINSTTVTFRAGSLADVVGAINASSPRHGVVAEIEGSCLKLTAQTRWTLDTTDPLPTGLRLGVSFRPFGPPLTEGADALLQGLDYWQDGDLILLNGQHDEKTNGVYRFTRGGASSPYSLVNPITGVVGEPLAVPYVYDRQDGVAYRRIDDAYRQFTLDLRDGAWFNGALTCVGAFGSILRTVDFQTWTSVPGGSDTLTAITASDTGLMAVGQRGSVMTSPDGVVWERTHAGKGTFHDVAYHAGEFLLAGDEVLFWRDGVVVDAQTGGSTTALSAQFTNGQFIVTHRGNRTMREIEPVVDGTDILLPSPLPMAGYIVRVVNIGTVITSHTHGKTDRPIAIPVVDLPSKLHCMVVVNGDMLTDDQYHYEVGTDDITFTLPVYPDVREVVITTFNGPDKTIMTTREETVQTVEFIAGTKPWRSGYWTGFTTGSASAIPVTDMIVVRKNGLEVMPPDSSHYVADGISSRFPLVPPAASTAMLEVHLNGVEMTIGDTPDKDLSLVRTVDGRIRELSFRTIPTGKITVMVWGENGYTVDEEGRILFTDEPLVGDLVSLMEFNENSSMGIATDLFYPQDGDHRYIIGQRPYNGDHLIVSVNGETKTHMRDYIIDTLSIGGWDTMEWGGLEQFGKWEDKVINPSYLDYIAAGGKPPVWNGRDWVEGDVTSPPLSTVPYGILSTPYSGPFLYVNPTAGLLQGPPAQPYGWDVVYEGAVVRFDVPQMAGDRVKITTMAGSPYRPAMAWRTYRDGYNQWEAIRVADAHKLILGHDLPLTVKDIASTVEEELAHGQRIRLYANPAIPVDQLPHLILPVPHSSVPGVVWINGERIEYRDVTYMDGDQYLTDARGRYLEISSISRGTAGTPYGVATDEDRLSLIGSGNTLTLPRSYKSVVVKVDGQIIPWREDGMKFNPQALAMTRTGDVLTFTHDLTGKDIALHGMMADLPYCHREGTIVLDGSYQQHLTAFQTFDLGVKGDVGKSNLAGVTFLQRSPGSKTSDWAK